MQYNNPEDRKALNHHSGVLLPYGRREDGRIYFVLEEKSADYKPPFFDRGLNFLGGNSVEGDKSPEDIARREIEEEFWCSIDGPEDINEIMGQDFLKQRAEIDASYDSANVGRIQQVGRMFLDGMRHFADYRMETGSPITKEYFVWGNTIFTREMEQKELDFLDVELKAFGGKLTTDNLRRDSRVIVVSLEEANEKNLKFAWGYDHIISDIAQQLVPGNHGVIRPLKLVTAERIELPRKSESGPSFDDFREAGYSYKQI